MRCYGTISVTICDPSGIAVGQIVQFLNLANQPVAGIISGIDDTCIWVSITSNVNLASCLRTSTWVGIDGMNKYANQFHIVDQQSSWMGYYGR